MPQAEHRLPPFAARHIGPRETDIEVMLKMVGCSSLDEFIAAVVPSSIRTQRPLALEQPLGEQEALDALRAVAEKNKVYRSFIGLGYQESITPGVILRIRDGTPPTLPTRRRSPRVASKPS